MGGCAEFYEVRKKKGRTQVETSGSDQGRKDKYAGGKREGTVTRRDKNEPIGALRGFNGQENTEPKVALRIEKVGRAKGSYTDEKGMKKRGLGRGGRMKAT